MFCMHALLCTTFMPGDWVLGAFEAGVADDCEPHCACWKLNMGPLGV